VLTDPPPWTQTAKPHEVLLPVPKIGPARVHRTRPLPDRLRKNRRRPQRPSTGRTNRDSPPLTALHSQRPATPSAPGSLSTGFPQSVVCFARVIAGPRACFAPEQQR